jgi:hypothetical protein
MNRKSPRWRDCTGAEGCRLLCSRARNPRYSYSYHARASVRGGRSVLVRQRRSSKSAPNLLGTYWHLIELACGSTWRSAQRERTNNKSTNPRKIGKKSARATRLAPANVQHARRAQGCKCAIFLSVTGLAVAVCCLVHLSFLGLGVGRPHLLLLVCTCALPSCFLKLTLAPCRLAKLKCAAAPPRLRCWRARSSLVPRQHLSGSARRRALDAQRLSHSLLIRLLAITRSSIKRRVASSRSSSS